MDTLTAIHQRFSANRFDQNRPVAAELLDQLIDAARQAPSAFNLQQTRFFAVQDLEARKVLRGIAYNQAKVEEAPLVIVVLGDLKAHEQYEEIANADEQAGIYDQRMAEYFTNAVKTGYADSSRAHDEAIRSGSLAAMNLMNAATSLGLVTGPMIGFDQEKFRKAFDISDRYLPVIMITVGYNAPGNWPHKTRHTVEKLLERNGQPGRKNAFST